MDGSQSTSPQWTIFCAKGPDGPTIGLLLCESHNNPIAEYALRDIAKPIGVSIYRVTRLLPEPLQAEVPSIEDLQEVVEKLRSEIQELKGKDAFESTQRTDIAAKYLRFLNCSLMEAWRPGPERQAGPVSKPVPSA